MQMRHFAGSLARFVAVAIVVEPMVRSRECVAQPRGPLGSTLFRCSASSQITSFVPLSSCRLARAAPRFHQKCSLAAFHVV